MDIECPGDRLVHNITVRYILHPETIAHAFVSPMWVSTSNATHYKNGHNYYRRSVDINAVLENCKVQSLAISREVQ